VRRHDRDFLLRIRAGAYTYEELVDMANEKIAGMEQLYERSGLPDAPDEMRAGSALVEIREKLYETAGM
jgi:hypothetical protein